MRYLRFGVIGWRYWGSEVARNLASLPDAIVSMVVNMDVCRLTSSKASQAGIEATMDVQKLMRSKIDAIVAPMGTHCQHVREALLNDSLIHMSCLRPYEIRHVTAVT